VFRRLLIGPRQAGHTSEALLDPFSQPVKCCHWCLGEATQVFSTIPIGMQINVYVPVIQVRKKEPLRDDREGENTGTNEAIPTLTWNAQAFEQ